jgi:hypothetical protein
MFSYVDCPGGSIETRQPSFHPQAVRGKAFYFTACWENTRGKKSIFGDIQRVFIP